MNTTTIDMNLGVSAVEAGTAVFSGHATAQPSEAVGSASEAAGESAQGIRERGPEMAVAALLMGLGGLVVFDSLRMGAGWADDGPQSGYFPFYIGLMLMVSSACVLFKALRGWAAERAGSTGAASGSPMFVEHEQLRLVMAMLVPATLYVVAMGFTGLYAASVVLIAWFMRRHGGFGWTLSSAVSFGVPITVFVVFERWFLVPLPKGPIERLLGF